MPAIERFGRVLASFACFACLRAPTESRDSRIFNCASCKTAQIDAKRCQNAGYGGPNSQPMFLTGFGPELTVLAARIDRFGQNTRKTSLLPLSAVLAVSGLLIEARTAVLAGFAEFRTLVRVPGRVGRLRCPVSVKYIGTYTAMLPRRSVSFGQF